MSGAPFPGKRCGRALSLCQVLSYLHPPKSTGHLPGCETQMWLWTQPAGVISLTWGPPGATGRSSRGTRCFWVLRSPLRRSSLAISRPISAPTLQPGDPDALLLTGSFEPSKQHSGPDYLTRVIRRCTCLLTPKPLCIRWGGISALKYPGWGLRQGPGGILCAPFSCCFCDPGGGSTVQSSLLEDALRQELQLEAGEPHSHPSGLGGGQLLVCGQEPGGHHPWHEEMVNWAHDLLYGGAGPWGYQR